MLKSHWPARLVLVAIGGLALGCSSATGALAEPPEYNPENQTKCMVAKSQNKPLLVEWPAADRAELEGNMKRGLVAVRYEGCEMEVLSRCITRGDYRYVGLSPKRDELIIKNEDELYAKMPLGAVSLSADLSKTGELRVAMTIVGRYDSQRLKVYRDELSGDCDQATHVVYGLSVGAFRLSTGSAVTAGGGVAARNVEVGASGSSSKDVLRADGDEAACTDTSDASNPPERCASLIRVEIMPIEPSRSGSAEGAAPSAPADQSGPGTGKSPRDTAQEVFDDYRKLDLEPFIAKWAIPRQIYLELMVAQGDSNPAGEYDEYMAEIKEKYTAIRGRVDGPMTINWSSGKLKDGSERIKVGFEYPTKQGESKIGKVEMIRLENRLYLFEIY